MRIQSVLAIAFVGAVGLLSSQKAHAQDQGTIIGDVVDGDTGDNVAGVLVTATSPSLQGKQTATSDAAGKFRIDGLPIGVYSLSFQKEGFAAEPITDIQLRAGATLRYDAVVYKGESNLAGPNGGTPAAPTGEKTVRVTATAPVVDVGSTQTGGTINADISRRVPLVPPGGKGGAQRSFEAAAASLPQVQNDVYGASVNGATSVENQYVIDGVSVNNTGFGYLGSPLSLEFIDEVSVITGGYMPEYGRSMGGLLNVVTKSGSNETHGSVFAHATPGFLEGERQQPIDLSSSVRATTKLNYVGDVGFELGGPILTDSLWYYVGADISQQSFQLTRKLFKSDGSFIQGTQQDFFAEGTNLQALAKLTWAPNADNRVTFTLIATPSTSGGDGKFSIDPLTGRPEVGAGSDPIAVNMEGSYNALAHVRRSGSIDGEIKWTTSLLEKKLKFDTSIGYHNELGGELPSDGSDITLDAAHRTGLAAVPQVVFRRTAAHGIADFETLPATAGCDAPGTNPATLCPQANYIAGGPGFVEQQQFNMVQARSVATYLADLAGLHVVKAGAEVGYGAYDELKGHTGDIVYRESRGGGSYTDFREFGYLTGPDSNPNNVVELPFLHAVTHNLFVAGFLQDSWSIADIVTLNLGLRYDGEWIQGGDGVNAFAMPNEISPRAGVIIDPFQSGKVKIFGSYARYYETIPLDIADRQGTAEPQPFGIHTAQQFGDPDTGHNACNPLDPKEYTGATSDCHTDKNRVQQNDNAAPNQKYIVIGSGRTPVDPNIQPPSSDEVTLGAEAEVFKDARLGVTYTRRWIGCPFDGAPDAICTRAIEDMSNDEANTYFIGNPGYGIATGFPKAQRVYDALTFSFYKQFGDGWLAQASYTLSQLQGNYAGLFRPETEQLDPNINSDFDLKSLVVNRFGPLPFDHTHAVKAYGAKEFETANNTKFTLGGGASAQSGAPSNTLGSHPLYGPGEVYILPRGTGERLPPLFSLDGHAGFTFQPFKGQAIEITLDVFNIFNFQSATLLDEEYTKSDVLPLTFCDHKTEQSCSAKDLAKLKNSDGTAFDVTGKNPNFDEPVEYQAPRTIQIGARWSF